MCLTKIANFTVFKGGDELTPINCVLTKMEIGVPGVDKIERGFYNLIND